MELKEMQANAAHTDEMLKKPNLLKLLFILSFYWNLLLLSHFYCTMSQQERWTANTLRRATGQAYNTLQRARNREISYPVVSNRKPALQHPATHINLDDAFSSVMQSLSAASRNCLKYYRSSSALEQNKHDRRFCARYLASQTTEKRRKNPLQAKEDMHILVSPGTYSVTAATLEGDCPAQQTHVIKVGRGETAAIDFTI